MPDKEIYDEVVKVLKAVEIPYIMDEKTLHPRLEENYRLPGGITKNVYSLAFFMPSQFFKQQFLYFAYLDPETLKVLFITSPQYIIYINYNDDGSIARGESERII